MAHESAAPAPAVSPSAPDGSASAPPWLRGAVAALAFYRVLYHLVYLRDVPFAVATISDGRLYEQAAMDIVAHAPLGSAPFYLQGLYAYQLALPIAVGGMALALLVQLALAGGALWLLHRTLRAMLGARVGAIGMLLALGHPPLAFYENKFLSAALTVACSIAVLAAFAWAERRSDRWPPLVLGLCCALAILARPNLALAVPLVAVALLRRAVPQRGRVGTLAALGLGLVLGLAPMAWRNAVVTGTPTVFPAHGGGTSFYIGNNAHARGVWNPAGIFSGDVTREREELGVVDDGGSDAAARTARMGDELYARAWQEIGDDPGRWLWLLVRKAWLMLGSDELAQDYDVLGEREMIPWAFPVGVPFGLLAALALLGAAVWRRSGDARVPGRAWLLGGLALATVAGNIGFFTSSQHRLPLAIPLVVLAASGAHWLAANLRTRAQLHAHRVALAAAAVVLLQSWWPRTRVREPSAVHYYNLALAFDHVGEPRPALTAIERALARAPDHPLMLIERATLRRRTGDFVGAQADLARLAAMPELPAWVHTRVVQETHDVAIELRRAR